MVTLWGDHRKSGLFTDLGSVPLKSTWCSLTGVFSSLKHKIAIFINTMAKHQTLHIVQQHSQSEVIEVLYWVLEPNLEVGAWFFLCAFNFLGDLMKKGNKPRFRTWASLTTPHNSLWIAHPYHLWEVLSLSEESGRLGVKRWDFILGFLITRLRKAGWIAISLNLSSFICKTKSE